MTIKLKLRKNKLIQDWLNKKPGTPALTVDFVLEQYEPPERKRAGQYFAPLPMVKAALQEVNFNTGSPLRGIDVCAGIGHFMRPFEDLVREGKLKMDAFEIDEECVTIGQALFPWADWKNQIPFTVWPDLSGKYDFVLLYPPIGTTTGIQPGKDMAESRSSRSEHLFLELAIRALKPGGQAIVLAHDTFVDRLPKRARRWQMDHASLVKKVGPLPTGGAKLPLSIFAYYFQRKDATTNQLNKETQL